MVDRMRASVSSDFALGVQRFAGPATNAFAPNGVSTTRLSSSSAIAGKRDDLPPFLLQDMADEIVFVQPLHDDDDRALGLVVEARIERAVEPFVGGGSAALRHGVARLQRIVDDDEVGAAAR